MSRTVYAIEPARKASQFPKSVVGLPVDPVLERVIEDRAMSKMKLVTPK